MGPFLLLFGTSADLALLVATFAALVVLSALFSATEASLLSLPAYHRRRLGEAGEAEGAIGRLLARPNRLLVTVLVGNYLVNVSAAAVAVVIAAQLAGETTLLVVFAGVVAAALLLLAVGEFLPRALATLDPDATARTVAPFVLFTGLVLRPIVWVFERTSAALFRVFGAPMTRRVFLDDEELKHMIEVGREQGILEEEEEEMISAVIDFGDTTAAEAMVPRTDMVAVPDTAEPDEIAALMTGTGFSRIPVYHDDVDNIIGVVYGKDLLAARSRGKDATAGGLVRQALFVPETSPLQEVLREMRLRRVHMAILLDEFGGTAGLITMEDLLEEIVGDIFDEYDPEVEPIEWVEDGVAVLDARMSVEEVNEALETDIPVDEGYETLGGYLFHRLGRPGRPGDEVRHDGLAIRVEHVANRRILRARAERVAGDDALEHGSPSA